MYREMCLTFLIWQQNGDLIATGGSSKCYRERATTVHGESRSAVAKNWRSVVLGYLECVSWDFTVEIQTRYGCSGSDRAGV